MTIARRQLGTVGDADPITYGGGVVYTDGEERWVEWVHGLDGGDTPKRMTVYRAELLANAGEFTDVWDWIDWGEVARAVGADGESYPPFLKSIRGRAWAVCDAAGYYGWHEFDQYPLVLAVAELAKRWGLDPEYYKDPIIVQAVED